MKLRKETVSHESTQSTIESITDCELEVGKEDVAHNRRSLVELLRGYKLTLRSVEGPLPNRRQFQRINNKMRARSGGQRHDEV